MAKRILITSIPCWNQKTGANTFATLFEGYDSHDLANIYISPGLPDSNVCSRYFSVREWQVMKSVFMRRVITGEEVGVNECLEDNNVERELERTKQFARKRRRIFLWMRELGWKLGNWNSAELDAFLEDFNPDVLVFPIESYPYFNRLNEYIIRKCKPKKVIGYLWDDNFTYKQFPNDLLYKVERYFLRKQVRRLVGLCNNVLSISPKMKLECDAEFGINSTLLTKPIRESLANPYNFSGFPVRFLYTGSLVIGRDKVLLQLAEAIDKINKELDFISLDVYTMTQVSDEYKTKFSSCRLCNLHGGILQSEVFREQENSDVLVFAESLDSKNQVARLSFSTKITDYISSKRCVFVVGQESNASVQYFKENDAAIICSDINQIYAILQELVENPGRIREYAIKAEQCGIKNHSREQILETLCQVIQS